MKSNYSSVVMIKLDDAYLYKLNTIANMLGMSVHELATKMFYESSCKDTIDAIWSWYSQNSQILADATKLSKQQRETLTKDLASKITDTFSK